MFLASLVAATGLGPLAMSSFVPAIPEIQEEFAVSAGAAQLTLSVSLITMAICSLFYGTLADRLGRRPVVIGGVVLAIVGSLVSVIGMHIVVVILGRALQAAGGTVGFVLARVIVRDVYGDDKAASVLGYITAAMTLAPLAGPLIGGYLIDAYGWRSVFLVVASFGTVLLALLFWQLPETRTPSTSVTKPAFQPAVFRTLLARASYLRVLVFGAALQATFMAFVSAAPFLLIGAYDEPISRYGVYFMAVPAGFFAGSLIAGRYAEALGNRWLMRAGGILSLASCLSALAAAEWIPGTPWGFFLPAAALAVAHGAALPGAQVILLSESGSNDGAGSGLFSFVQLLTGAAIAQLTGAVLGAGPMPVATIMSSAALIALLVALPTGGSKQATTETA